MGGERRIETVPIIKDPVRHEREKEIRQVEILVERIAQEWREKMGIYHGRTLTAQVMRRLLGKATLTVPAVTLGIRLGERGWVKSNGAGAWYFTEAFISILEGETGVKAPERAQGGNDADVG